jgi:hypothetical protein
MTGTQLFIVVVILLAALCATLFVVRERLQGMRQDAHRRSIIRNLLDVAQGQNEIFDICVQHNDTTSKTLSGMLTGIFDNRLEMEVLSFVSRELVGSSVDVYFRALMEEGLAFYKFHSVIQRVESVNVKHLVTLAFPKDIDAGQKRHFIRVKPPKDTIRVIGVWELDEAKPIPRTTGDIGKPLLHYKQGMETETVQVADISATGMALRFPTDSLEVRPVDLDKGSQLLCLIIYHAGKDDHVVTFWCTCNVINTRMQQEPTPALTLGTEFTNWAVLEPGKAEINWFQSKQASGVSPITQWVMQMDIKQSKFF